MTRYRIGTVYMYMCLLLCDDSLLHPPSMPIWLSDRETPAKRRAVPRRHDGGADDRVSTPSRCSTPRGNEQTHNGA